MSMKDLIKVIVRRGVVFGGLLMLFVMFGNSIDVNANSICCGVYTKQSSTTSEQTGWSVYGDSDSTYLCGQTLYVEIMVSDGAYSIDYATLYIDGNAVYTLNDYEDDNDKVYSWASHPHVFTATGVHTCRWVGKWANSEQTFDISNTLYLNTITKGTYSTYNFAGDNVQYSVSITGANTNKTYSYQWYYATSSGGTKTKIAGATDRTYSFPVTSNLNNRYYYCYVSNGYVNGFSTAFPLYIKYKVSYDANGGTDTPNYQTKYHDENLTIKSNVPTRKGYTFLGWSTSSTATVANSNYAPGSIYSTNANLNLYAVWEAKKYSVTYNANGGSGAPSSQTKYYEKTLTLRTTKPTRIGYNFLGWSTNSNATTATYQPGDAYTHNMGATLYAVWRPNEYDVCYDANGGSGAPLLQTKYYGQPLTLSRIEPTRTGYTFLGWSTKNTSTIVSYSASGTYTVNEPIILYAVWKKNESNSGTQSSNTTTVTKPATTQKTSSSTPVKKKYVFKVGQIVKVGFLKYKIIKLSGNSGTVTVIGATNKKAKKLVIPQNIKKNGITFKITEIAKNAFKNYKKLSFLRIKASSIIKIGKNALKGTKRKIKIMVPTSKLKQYSKMIKKAR